MSNEFCKSITTLKAFSLLVYHPIVNETPRRRAAGYLCPLKEG